MVCQRYTIVFQHSYFNYIPLVVQRMNDNNETTEVFSGTSSVKRIIGVFSGKFTGVTSGLNSPNNSRIPRCNIT